MARVHSHTSMGDRALLSKISQVAKEQVAAIDPKFFAQLLESPFVKIPMQFAKNAKLMDSPAAKELLISGFPAFRDTMKYFVGRALKNVDLRIPLSFPSANRPAQFDVPSQVPVNSSMQTLNPYFSDEQTLLELSVDPPVQIIPALACTASGFSYIPVGASCGCAATFCPVGGVTYSGGAGSQYCTSNANRTCGTCASYRTTNLLVGTIKFVTSGYNVAKYDFSDCYKLTSLAGSPSCIVKPTAIESDAVTWNIVDGDISCYYLNLQVSSSSMVVVLSAPKSVSDALGAVTAPDTCAAGYFRNTKLTTGCVLCSADLCSQGYFFNSTACSTYSNGCTKCSPGFYQSHAKQTSCIACEVTRYSTTSAATDCLTCGDGYTSLRTKQTGCTGEFRN